MGELGVANSDGGPLQRAFGSGCNSSTPPDPPLLCQDCLSAAEEAAQQVLNSVHPTLDSEEKRRDIVDYIQRLVKSNVNCEVFPYGSVPLKTYLPDGDIDFTVVKGPNAEESLAHDVFTLLKKEEKNENAEFQVKDTQFIDAEVKLVKCLVRNIVVDISFNQLGGFSSLCVLEQVDRVVQRNHLFKRSIILVKAWCYYESRILGAHHGLMSTYALETLVLYIFHLFHPSLRGPLEVLYRFLEYYSQFDWDNYCISLKGPVCKSALPDIVVNLPESGWNDLLLGDEYLENCIDMFSISSRPLERNLKAFQPKHFNIIDPLKESNNLGRSVHRGNFYRIRSAFRYGARQLGHVLSGPRDKVTDEISDFFANTLERHANDYRSSIQQLALEFGDEESLTASVSSPIELLSEDDILLKTSISDVDNGSVGLEFKNEINRYSTRELSSEMGSEGCYFAEGAVSGPVAGESYTHTTSNSSVMNGSWDHASSSNVSASLSWNNHHKPSYFSSKISAEIGSFESGNSHQSDLLDNDSQKFGSNLWSEESEEHGKRDNTHQWCMDNSQPVGTTSSGYSITKVNVVDDASLDFREMDLTSTGGESEAFNPLADLSGDYESNIRSLLYGQLCHLLSLSASILCHSPSLPSTTTPTKKSSDIGRCLVPFWECQLSRMSSQPVSMGQSMSLSTDSALNATAFRSDRTQKARGIGTYFPIVNGLYRERHSVGRGKYRALGNRNQFRRYDRNNVSALGEPNNSENVFHGVVPERSRYQVRGQSSRSVGDGNQTSGYMSTTCRIEFGSIGNLAHELLSAPPAGFRGSPRGTSSKTQGTTAAAKQERVGGASIHLKNEAEFPPLCQTMH